MKVTMVKQEWSHALILLMLVVALLRIPNLFEPYWYGDEGVSLVLGQAMRRGLVLYRDIHDNKPPLLYLVAAIAGTQFWFKFILLFWHLATIIMFYKLAELLFPKYPNAPIVASTLMALLTMLPEGNIANGEIFMILPVVVGMLLLWQEKRQYFLSGVLFALGFLFKVPAALDFAGAFVFLTLFQSSSFSDLVKRIFRKDILLFVLGFVLPITLSIAYYATKGALFPYLYSALLQNIGYLGSWSAGKQGGAETLARSGFMVRSMLLGICIVLLLKAKKWLTLSMPLQFSVVWFLFALYGALLSERPYPHYLIQPAVPAALALTFLVFEKQKKAQITVFAVGFVAVVSYSNVGFWQYPILSYYQNFLNWTLKRETTERYFSYFGNQVNRTYRVAKYIKLMTRPEDRLFVWGDEPMVYALSERLPVGRYTVAYHVADFNGYEETIAVLRNTRPPIILTFQGETRPFPALLSELSSQYVLTKQIDDAFIYKRL